MNDAGFGKGITDTGIAVVSPRTSDRTGVAPYSMANSGKKVRSQVIPNTFVREPFLGN